MDSRLSPIVSIAALVAACSANVVSQGTTTAGAGGAGGARPCAVLPNPDGTCPEPEYTPIEGAAVDAKRRCWLPRKLLGCGPSTRAGLNMCKAETTTGIVYVIAATTCMPEGPFRDCTGEEEQLVADAHDGFPACP